MAAAGERTIAAAALPITEGKAQGTGLGTPKAAADLDTQTRRTAVAVVGSAPG